MKGLCVLLACAASAATAGEITVSAAASLGGAFREAAQAYEATHPGEKIHLNFAASDALVAQIAKGAPVDVFASADQDAMDKAAAHIVPDSRRNFASNRLVVAVRQAGGPAPRGLADLARPGYQRIAIGNPASVPAGRYARSALEKAGLWGGLAPKLVFATNVRQALDYVARGEAEAGFVYMTDVSTQGDKVRAAMVVPTAAPITYPLAVLRGAPNAAGARGFTDFILSAGGRAILARHGFGKP